MTELLFFAKASVVMAAAALALVRTGRRSSSATRHLICTSAIAALLVLPILSAMLPAWSLIPLPEGRAFALPPIVEREAVSRPAETGSHVLDGPARSGPDVLDGPIKTGHYIPTARRVSILVYVGGVLLLMIRLLVDQFTARRIVRHAEDLIDPDWRTLFEECADGLGVRAPVRLLRSRDRMTPMAIGIRSRAIVLPASADTWSVEMRRTVLLHELAHVARHDCLTQTAAAFVCALYWIHPGSWWLARRLRIERELACDDLVLTVGTDARDYAAHLLELSYTLRGRLAPALAVGMSAPRQLEARMLALLDRARNRAVPTRRRQAVMFAIVAVLLVPIAAATGMAFQSSDPTTRTPVKHDIRPEWYRGLLTPDFWRRVAINGLTRLADQTNYLGEMRRLGYSMTDVNVLFALRQHGVSPELVRSLAAEGLSGLSSDELLLVVSHGVTPEFVHDLNGLGYGPLGIESLVRLRRHGVDGDFIRDLAGFGYRWSIDQLVQARSHGVDGDFLRALASCGYEHLTLDDLTLLRSHGVESGYIGALQELGYAGLTPQAFARLRSHGVTVPRVKEANARAGAQLSVDQLTDLASRGWK